MNWIDMIIVALVLVILYVVWRGRKEYNDASAALDQGDYLREMFNDDAVKVEQNK